MTYKSCPNVHVSEFAAKVSSVGKLKTMYMQRGSPPAHEYDTEKIYLRVEHNTLLKFYPVHCLP